MSWLNADAPRNIVVTLLIFQALNDITKISFLPHTPLIMNRTGANTAASTPSTPGTHADRALSLWIPSSLINPLTDLTGASVVTAAGRWTTKYFFIPAAGIPVYCGILLIQSDTTILKYTLAYTLVIIIIDLT